MQIWWGNIRLLIPAIVCTVLYCRDACQSMICIEHDINAASCKPSIYPGKIHRAGAKAPMFRFEIDQSNGKATTPPYRGAMILIEYPNMTERVDGNVHATDLGT